MDTKNSKLTEQEAPLKNTDDAYVQVGQDGQPVMPSVKGTPGYKDKEDASKPKEAKK